MTKKEIIHAINQGRLRVRSACKDAEERLRQLAVTPTALTPYEMDKMQVFENEVARMHSQMEYLDKIKSVLRYVDTNWFEE